MKKYCIGMGLLEIMLALAVIAMLLLGAIKYYQVVRVSGGSHELVKQVGGIIAASERWTAAHQGSFAGITDVQKLIDAGFISSEFIQNEWGGKIDVKSLTSFKIKISLTQLPSNLCYNVGQKLGIQDAELEKQCTISVDSQSSLTTLFYCYPDQEKCPS